MFAMPESLSRNPPFVDDEVLRERLKEAKGIGPQRPELKSSAS
jgi:hypothetical protein